jgi:ribosome-associated protein
LTEVQSVKTPGSKSSRLTKSSKILKVIIQAIKDKKGENIVSLDLRKIPEAVSDFFIICEGSVNVQVKAIADYVEHKVKEECGETSYRQEGYQSLEWVLVDYVNVVVHVFQREPRKFYQLEELWSDSVREEHIDEPPPPRSTEARKKIN